MSVGLWCAEGNADFVLPVAAHLGSGYAHVDNAEGNHVSLGRSSIAAEAAYSAYGARFGMYVTLGWSLLHSFFSGDGIKKEGAVSFVPINISIASENDMPLTLVR